MRVAVTQFATTTNTQENLATCVRMINQAAQCKPDLIVLPEYCNTQPWYTDHNQAWGAALSVKGPFLQEIATQAKQHQCFIILSITLQKSTIREHENGAIKSNITLTSCCFSPLGKLVHQVDKQTLTEHEHTFFVPGDTNASLISTDFGALGILAGYDGASFAMTRALGINGAQLLCHSLSTFALDQSTVHELAHASENNVFSVSANKVGSLFPQEKYANADSNSNSNSIQGTEYQIPKKYLIGAGQSQIIAPDGKVLAKLEHNEAGFAFADIELTTAGLQNKSRPDGTKLLKQLKRLHPEFCSTLIASPLTCVKEANANKVEQNKDVPQTVNVAIFATYKTNEQAIEDVCHYIENNLSDIIQLPELFFVADKTLTHDVEQFSAITLLSQQLITKISAQLRPFQYVCTSLLIDGAHQAVLIGNQGILATQQQLHFCQRYQWTTLGDNVSIIALPLEQGVINVAMLTGDDANIPEAINMAASNNIHLLLVPFDIQEPSDVAYGFISQAAEYRICILAASREKSFKANLPIETSNSGNKSKIKSLKSTGLIATLPTETALFLQLQTDKFTGYINAPLVKHQHGKITKAIIHPLATCDKDIATKI